MFTSNMLFFKKKEREREREREKDKDEMFLFVIKHCAMQVYGGSVNMAPSMFFFFNTGSRWR